jgi:Gpi18-like mannosyltransferase
MGMTNLPVDAGEKTRVWHKAGWWFWLAILLGLAIRIYLVVFTEGTYDVGIWQKHAIGVRELGLVGYYHSSPKMNHPPLISVLVCWLWNISQAAGIPFRVLFRAPFALLDGGTTLLLLLIFSKNRWRFVIGACYWLHPLAMIFSAYHGNVDSAVAFFLLLGVWLLSREKMMWAAIVLGASFWVKLSGVMAIPAFVFFVRGWRRRLLFLAMIGAAGILTYVPSFLIDPLVVYNNVFGYHGQIMDTVSGVPVFGSRIFITAFLQGLPPEWELRLYHPLIFLIKQSWFISLLLIVLFGWLRRSCSTVSELGVTIAAVYTILYGFSNYWAFQYFAWSIPFWFFARRWFSILATVLAGGYIYSLYWLFCGNPCLLGKWGSINYLHWPEIVIVFRDLAVLFFFISACIFLIDAAYKQIVRRPIKGQE